MEESKGISLDRHCGINSQGRISSQKFERHFVSHGHTDHLPTAMTGKQLLCSDVTLKMLQHRVKRKNPVTLFQDDSFEMIPSGHTLGSKMLHLKEHCILYTGDMNPEKSYCGEAKYVRCKTLIIESTFGNPRYVFPKRTEVLKEIVDFVKGQEQVMFDVYPFGKAQELCYLFDKHKIPFWIGDSVQKIHETLNLGFRYETNDASVVIGTGDEMNGLMAGCSGWAVDAGFAQRFRFDHSFVLSNHADFPHLLSFVKKCKPETVLTFHGFAEGFAAELRKEGFNAYPLSNSERQLFHYF